MTNHIQASALRPRAYSYLRFSTPEQSKGDSLRRQSAMARDYARRNGLDLDETLTFHDLGVSAFRGQNLAEGRLAYFREAVGTVGYTDNISDLALPCSSGELKSRPQ